MNTKLIPKMLFSITLIVGVIMLGYMIINFLPILIGIILLFGIACFVWMIVEGIFKCR